MKKNSSHLQDFSLKKTFHVKFLVYHLLIQATFVLVSENYDKVAKYLSEQKDEVDFETHFYRNQEWWRRRVRMIVPEIKIHVSNIKLFYSLFLTEEIIKEYYSQEVKEYFEYFIKKLSKVTTMKFQGCQYL